MAAAKFRFLTLIILQGQTSQTLRFQSLGLQSPRTSLTVGGGSHCRLDAVDASVVGGILQTGRLYHTEKRGTIPIREAEMFTLFASLSTSVFFFELFIRSETRLTQEMLRQLTLACLPFLS